MSYRYKYKSKRHSYRLPKRSTVESMSAPKSNPKGFPTKTELDACADKEISQKIQAIEQRIADLTTDRDRPDTTGDHWLELQHEINLQRVRLKHATHNTDPVVPYTLQ